jgi:hypothetical protein
MRQNNSVRDASKAALALIGTVVRRTMHLS